MALFRAKSLLRLGIVCALVLGACTPLPLGQPRFMADTLVGADAWFVTSITMRPSLQQALSGREVMNLLEGPLADAGTDLQRVPTPSGQVVDFERDVLPLLDGEIIVAGTGPIADPQIVVLVHTSDVERAMRLLASSSQPRLSRDARTVMSYEPGSGPAALIGYKNWVVYSESAVLREQTLERIDGRGGPTLASDARYRAVVDRLQGDRLGYGYMNVSPLIDVAALQDPRLTTALQGRGQIAFAFGFEAGPAPSARVFGTRVEYIPEEPIPSPELGSGDALALMDRLPKASMMAFGGPDLAGYLESLTQSLAEVTFDEDLFDLIDALATQFDGPWAAGVTTPTVSRGTLSEPSFEEALGTLLGGVFFLATLSADADTELLTEIVDTVAVEAGGELGDGAPWQYELLTENDLLAINAVPPTTSLEALPEDLLASEQTYQWVRAGMSQSGTNMYLNLEALFGAVLGPLASSDELAPLRPFRAIGASSITEPRGDVHGRMTVLIVFDE